VSAPIEPQTDTADGTASECKTPNRRRILLVTPTLPYPPNWGFGTRVYQLIKNLARRHEIALAAYASPSSDTDWRLDHLRSVCAEIHTVVPNEREGTNSRLLQARSVLGMASYQVRKLRSDALKRVVNEMLHSGTFDLCQVESSQLLAGLGLQHTVPVILDEHNLEFELQRRVSQEERSLLRRAFAGLEYCKVRREEMAVWRQIDGCALTSTRELAVLRAAVRDVPATVVPNGVDVEYFSDAGVKPDRQNIVFTGMLGYRPNVDGVLWFTREILPRVLKQLPSVVFTVVGTGVPPEVRRLEGPNVLVTGTVPDVRPYLGRAGVVVVPLRMGSGTRLKVLEGLAMGRPMVSTSLGCEGIEVRSGEHLLVADKPGEFSAGVVDLLRDPTRADAMGQRGREMVRRQYAWDRITTRLENLHTQVLAQRVLSLSAEPSRQL